MIQQSDFPIQQHDVFSAAECERIVAAIGGLREHWTARGLPSLYSLGAAAYLDAPEPNSARHFGAPVSGPDHYLQLAKKLNPILREHFGFVYDRMQRSLAEKLNAETRYHPDYALPGFHIFGDSPVFESQSAHVPHFDRPFVTLKWDTEEEIDFKQTISFTLSIKLPKEGGGLRLWDVTYYEVTSLPREQAKELVKSRKAAVHMYQTGSWICHSGNELHQILPWKSEPGDQRITLQGHGLFYENRWNLFW